MQRQIGHIARRGQITRLGVVLAALAVSAPALGQGGNPWSPPGAIPPAIYAGEAAPSYPGLVPGRGGAEASSLYAPPGLDAQLSGLAPMPAAPVLMPPQPQYPVAVAPQAAPPVAVPGTVIPVVPGVASYPGAAPYGAGAPGGAGYGYGYGYAPGTTAMPGYGAATQGPYGYAPTYGYGTGWPGYGTGYAPGWGGTGWPSTGFGTGWPGTGFSPFGFW